MGSIDKCLLPLGQTTILQAIVDRLTPQASTLYLNANGDANRFAPYALPIIQDSVFSDAGPLTGVASSLLELQTRETRTKYPETSRWLLTVPGDSPFLPEDLTSHLLNAVDKTSADIAYAKTELEDHYVFALWSIDLLAALMDYLATGQRSVKEFIQAQDYQAVDFPLTDDKLDPFFNINTPEQLREAEHHIHRQ